ncbi:d5fe46e6-b109-4836-b9c5-eb511e9d0f3b [Thermothielavioides terrestris]|uniref:D5fe46e6-b109-4836-b9c5-eb511e9d0f3b n=1 Tax=Thermothielavioides terrestris TaxID=2587410 RepID=A0A3S4AU48_9PEZI|nr:d5fe46e6-b109-4836-b9c5-eb511e9d0f3b [Thermothielavioides terrestris]
MAITTRKTLSGFRGIPPGAHFLWVQQPGGVSRCGYWFTTGVRGAVHTKQWDPYNELLVEPQTQSDTQAQSEANMETVYPTLQPYNLHDRRGHTSGGPVLGPRHDVSLSWARSPASVWKTLTSGISAQYLGRVIGRGEAREYLVDSTDVAKDSGGGSERDPARDTGGLDFLFAQDFRDLQVLDFGSMNAQVADTSPRIQALLARASNTVTERDILAEMQFTFLTGTHLGNPACLEHWWNVVLKIALRAYTLAASRPQLAEGLLRTLHAQLFYTEHYLDSSAPSSDAGPPTADTDRRPDDKATREEDPDSDDRPIFQYKPHNRHKLRQALARYKGRLGEVLRGLGSHITPAQQAVGAAFEDLETWLWRCNWDLRGEEDGLERGAGGGEAADSDEDEDQQPVIVELDEEGREVGLVSFRD